MLLPGRVECCVEESFTDSILREGPNSSCLVTLISERI